MEQDSLYRTLKYVAFTLAATLFIWILYDGVLRGAVDPLNAEYNRATRDFKDGRYEDAMRSYDAALQIEPGHRGSLSGKASALMLLGYHKEALRIYNHLVATYPDDGIHYANRGILHDRMGFYELAIDDYQRAYKLDNDLDKGPSWLTRFLRNQHKTPATILVRANYLKQQLALPLDQRVLKRPEDDQKERPYTRR